jgi:hypothetical protein
MKKLIITICAVLDLVLLGLSGSTNATIINTEINTDYSNPSSNGTSTTYDYDALAVMVETITDMGGGKWKYYYTLTNNDSKSIWYCNVWFDQISASVSALTTWVGHESTWSSNSGSNPTNYRLPGPSEQPFDIYTWGPSWPSGPDQIPVGATREGFSAVLAFYDPSPKQFGYMVNGHYWSKDHLDAVGWTIPEPATICLLGLGALSLIHRKRRV